MTSEPNIYSYSDYRVYLRDFYSWKKQTKPGFSHRVFANKAGLGSPNYLKLVMDGQRNLSRKTLSGFIRGLDLNGARSDYFENLALYNQTSSIIERQFYYQKILKHRVRLGLKPLEASQLRLFSEWYPMVVREMASMRGFSKTPSWIARALGGRVNESEAAAAFSLLIELGLLRKTSRGFAPVDDNITTSDEVSSIIVKKYHKQMIGLGLESLDRLPAAKRDISSVTFPLRSVDWPRLKERLQWLRKELLNLSALEGEGDMVVQLNFQLFPVASLE